MASYIGLTFLGISLLSLSSKYFEGENIMKKLTQEEMELLYLLEKQFREIASKYNVSINLIEDNHGTHYFHPKFEERTK